MLALFPIQYEFRKSNMIYFHNMSMPFYLFHACIVYMNVSLGALKSSNFLIPFLCLNVRRVELMPWKEQMYFVTNLHLQFFLVLKEGQEDTRETIYMYLGVMLH